MLIFYELNKKNKKNKICPDCVKSAGFTLIELLVVMLLLAIFTAFALPRVMSVFDSPLDTASRKLVNLFNETALAARNKQQTQRIVFSEDEINVEVRGKRIKKITLPEGSEVVRISTHYGGEQTTLPMTISFSKQGFTDKTLVYLQAGKEEEMTLFINPFLSVVKVFAGEVNMDDERINW